MNDLWYFEQRSFGAKGEQWSPTTSELAPTVHTSKSGYARIRGSDGALGPRIRGLVQVPLDLRGKTLSELHKAMNAGGADE